MEVQILTKSFEVVTAGELIAELSKVHPETIVVMSRDAEGNGYSPLSNVDPEDSAYLPETTWSGEISPTEITEEMKTQGWRDEDIASENHIPCVVLWPVN